MKTGKSFRAVLTRSGNALNWTVIRLPIDVHIIQSQSFTDPKAGDHEQSE